MCIVSMVTDGWHKDWTERFPDPTPVNPQGLSEILDMVSREEFNKLKQELEELKTTIKAAKRLDEAMGQIECEKDEKIIIIKNIAKAFGVDLNEVFNK